MKLDYIFRVIEAGGAQAQDANAGIGTDFNTMYAYVVQPYSPLHTRALA